MNNDLLEYLKINIFPLYNNNDNGHNLTHLNDVLDRSLKLAPEYDLDHNMAYTIAAYHDCGCH
ncbi:MAG: phosphohydrolase, partial [Candidatus Saccharibacteria bacterium]